MRSANSEKPCELRGSNSHLRTSICERKVSHFNAECKRKIPSPKEVKMANAQKTGP